MTEEWLEKFRKVYDKAESWKEADDLLNTLDETQLARFIAVHEEVGQLTGLDMRQEFYLSNAKAIKRYKFKKEVFASEKD